MASFKYIKLTDIAPNELLKILNEDSIRTHLIDHPQFDLESLHSWIVEKTETDQIKGCRIRGVLIDGMLAGWCGIQPDKHGFELAIVISQKYWGHGISIFRTLMQWARASNHSEVVFHLLDSRKEYKALRKMANKVTQTEWAGFQFTTYYFPVDN